MWEGSETAGPATQEWHGEAGSWRPWLGGCCEEGQGASSPGQQEPHWEGGSGRPQKP